MKRLSRSPVVGLQYPLDLEEKLTVRIIPPLWGCTPVLARKQTRSHQRLSFCKEGRGQNHGAGLFARGFSPDFEQTRNRLALACHHDHNLSHWPSGRGGPTNLLFVFSWRPGWLQRPATTCLEVGPPLSDLKSQFDCMMVGCIDGSRHY